MSENLRANKKGGVSKPSIFVTFFQIPAFSIQSDSERTEHIKKFYSSRGHFSEVKLARVQYCFNNIKFLKKKI